MKNTLLEDIYQMRCEGCENACGICTEGYYDAPVKVSHRMDMTTTEAVELLYLMGGNGLVGEDYFDRDHMGELIKHGYAFMTFVTDNKYVSQYQKFIITSKGLDYLITHAELPVRFVGR